MKTLNPLNSAYRIYKNDDFIYKLIYWIFFFVFYQQVFVVNIGGSFKIYELLALILLSYFLFYDLKIYSIFGGILFLFFVVSPIISTILFYLDDTKELFYMQYPEAKGNSGIRFNIFLYPFLILFYYFFQFATVNCIIASKVVYNKYKDLVRIYVISGTLVSLYSLYCIFGIVLLGLPDIIPRFIDFRNFSSEEGFYRTMGFSAEPSVYILCMSWICLYLWFHKDFFSKRYWKILFIINVTTLLLTFSSGLVGVIFSIILFLFLTNFKLGIKFLGILISVLIIGYVILNYMDQASLEVIEYALFYKIQDFLSLTNDMISSGGIRSFTFKLGLAVFEDHTFFGVGVGASSYYLWRYAYDFGSVLWGDNFGLDYQALVQNNHSKILAEQGAFGYLFFIGFFIYISRKLILLIKKTNKNEYKIGFIGTVIVFLLMISIHPIYSLFIWVNIALVINQLYWDDILLKK